MTDNSGNKGRFLVIVESPTKVRLIEKYLGLKYKVIASNGHICNIEGLKDINIKGKFETKYKIIDNKKMVVSNMRTIITRYKLEDIYIGTDDDVEGEKIAYDICCVFNLPLDKMKRIVFNEITEKALKNSIENPSVINMNVVRSQQARQILDILIGYKISPILWKYIHNKKADTLSAGRCQSSALSLIYDNEEESKMNVLNKSYKTTSRFLENAFEIELNLSKSFSSENEVRHFLELSKTYEHVVSLSDTFKTVKKKPTPLNTSRMIQQSSIQNKNSPIETMKLAQQLYHDGMITYMRTESTKYSQDFLTKASSFINEKYGISYVGNFENISNLVSKLPHEAIRVTDLKLKKIDGLPKLKKLYDLIYKNTIESCMNDATFESYNIIVSAPNHYLYSKQIDTSVFDGWLKYDGIKSEPNYYDYIKHLKTKILSCSEIKSVLTVKNSHSHYTEAGLIKRLEELGIGRPSTYPSFININIERGYIKKENIEGFKMTCIDFVLKGSIIEKESEKTFCGENDKLVIQESGILSIEFLKKYYGEIFNYSFTKFVEEKLDIIKNESENWSDICRETHDNINLQTKNVIKNERQEYVIDDSNKVKFLRFGFVIEHVNKSNGEVKFIPINPSLLIDIEKLKRNEYSLEELTEYNDPFSDSLIGCLREQPIHMMRGKYGPYLSYNSLNYNLKNIDITSMNLENAIKIIDKVKTNDTKTMLRCIDNNTSIRNGKNNKPYIFFKTEKMPKPLFFNIKDVDLLSCDPSIIISYITKNKLKKNNI